ncbi:MAG: 50S ribosomal protein L25 [Bacteriovoracaceae bacterium]|nr:50S ribosomal protein L25 [Bacteriovoracaceae bacterium]
MTLNLKAQSRDAGQSNKKLRKSGFIPCSMYGKSVESTEIQIPNHALVNCLKNGGRKVSIEVNGQSYLASIEEAQKEPASSKLLHVSFHAFNKNEEISMQVPLLIEGKAKGLVEGGILQQQTQTVLVHGKACDIPETIVVDVSKLDLGNSIHVSDLKGSNKFEIKESPDKTLVACNYPKLQPIDEVAPAIEAPEAQVEEVQTEEEAA